ncbi:MAG TPA: hypothetical protein VFP14_01310 [Novosphingobium sp.]|jgi:hypothetical protein|nr:hypothetical protein [Novosphingobium sp.]
MDRVSRLKGGGYLTSTISVVLLGIPAMKSAMESPMMLASLLAGMSLSVAGMALRWRSQRLQVRKERRERDEIRRQMRAA